MLARFHTKFPSLVSMSGSSYTIFAAIFFRFIWDSVVCSNLQSSFSFSCPSNVVMLLLLQDFFLLSKYQCWLHSIQFLSSSVSLEKPIVVLPAVEGAHLLILFLRFSFRTPIFHRWLPLELCLLLLTQLFFWGFIFSFCKVHHLRDWFVLFPCFCSIFQHWTYPIHF